MIDSRLLERHLEVATKYPNMARISGEDNVLEFYCDNQTLSSLRACRGFFHESFINNLRTKSSEAHGQAFFDIGIWFHSIMEFIDKELTKGIKTTTSDALIIAQKIWFEMNLEQFKGSRAYEGIGGVLGALDLVLEYMTEYGPAVDNWKIIATEMVFGYNKEVPLTTKEDERESRYEYRGYLVGRPDSVVETPLGIGIKDYKTTSRMDSVRDSYKPSEQIIGYVYALDKIMGATLAAQGKKCNTAYIIAVNKKKTKEPKDRVRRIPYTYSVQDLEQYRLRQVATLDMLYEQLVLQAVPDWNTMMCNNWYHKQCPFHQLHRCAHENREATIRDFYMVKEAWNPLTRGVAEKEEE